MVIENLCASALSQPGFGLFCGAGISLNSGMPLANDLKRYLLGQLCLVNDDIRQIMDADLPFEAFMDNLSENSNLSTLLSIFERGTPSTNHALIAKLARHRFIPFVATTNFDLLIEAALENEGLQRNRDFHIYYTEDDFAATNYDSLNTIAVYKLHGSAHDMGSVRTTLRAVAARTLSEKRQSLIEYLFSSGRHRSVLVLGYSCSDTFDITPHIESLPRPRKEIILVEHSEESEYIEPVGAKETHNPFRAYLGKRVKCNTDNFVKTLWTSLDRKIGDYKPTRSDLDWKTVVDDWVQSREERRKYFILGSLFSDISSVEKAVEHFEKARDLAKASGDALQEAACYINLANLCHEQRDVTKSIQYYEEALRIARRCGHKAGEMGCYAGLATAYARVGRLRRTIRFYKRGLKVAHETGEKQGESSCYAGLGGAYSDLSWFGKAEKCFSRGLEVSTAIGDKPGESICYIGLGLVRYRQGLGTEAIVFYKRALTLFKQLGNRMGQSSCYINLGAVYLALRKPRKAIDCYLKAEQFYKQENLLYFLKDVYSGLSLAYEQLGGTEGLK